MNTQHDNEDNSPKVVAQPDLLNAFVATFEDCERENDADRVFDYAALRQYFGCILIPKQPDPLPPYIEAMKEMGFTFRTTYDGQPAVFAKNKHKGPRNCPALFTDEENEQELALLGAQETKLLPCDA